MNRLKYYREKKGWSVADLSEKSGVSKVTIYKLERGDSGCARLATLRALSHALGRTIDTVFLPRK